MKSLKRQEQLKKEAEAVQQEKQAIDQQAVKFDAWWLDISRLLNLRFHMKEIIRADFKARGLKDSEKKEIFDAALKLFGYTLP